MVTVTTTMRGPMGRKRKEVDQSTYSGRVAARLRILREKSGKTVPEMAKALGIAAPTYYSYENARLELPLNLIPSLCEALGISVRQLFPKE